MEHIWSPWRYRYVASAEKQDFCVLCKIPQQSDDDRNLVLYRGHSVFIILNLFPYTTGHLMIAPYEHTASFARLTQEVSGEMFGLAKQTEVALEQEYRPDGFNIGMNLGYSRLKRYFDS